jgi:cytochrome P450
MADVAQVLPLAIVSDLVGLPDNGREAMLRWAAAAFNAMGPMNPRGLDAIPQVRELHIGRGTRFPGSPSRMAGKQDLRGGGQR